MEQSNTMENRISPEVAKLVENTIESILFCENNEATRDYVIESIKSGIEFFENERWFVECAINNAREIVLILQPPIKAPIEVNISIKA